MSLHTKPCFHICFNVLANCRRCFEPWKPNDRNISGCHHLTFYWKTKGTIQMIPFFKRIPNDHNRVSI